MALFPQTKSAEDISERDAGHLRTACRLPEFNEKTGQPNLVPAPVANFYWQVKQHFDRVGGTIFQPDTYAMIAAVAYALEQSGITVPSVVKEEKRVNVANLWHSQQLKHGDIVLVEWREEVKEARILGASVNRKQVTLEIDGEERKVPVETVRVPDAAMV